MGGAHLSFRSVPFPRHSGRGRPGCEPRCRTRCAALPYEPAGRRCNGSRSIFQDIIAYKEETLANEEPRCRLERNFSGFVGRSGEAQAFRAAQTLGQPRSLLPLEGLLIYFSAEEVASLAADLAAENRFQTWIIDLASPGQLRLMQRTTGKQLSEAGAAFKFGPPEGVNFFAPYGWEPTDVQGMLKTAAQFQPGASRTPLPVARTQRQSRKFSMDRCVPAQ